MKTALLFAVLAAAALSAPVRADELRLYFYPSPHGIDWRTPSRLTASVLWNALGPNFFPLRHEIGHASVGLQCSGPGATDMLTGATTADDSSESADLLKRKRGLGILFDTFSGRLQTREEVERDLHAREGAGKVDWLAIEISPALCQHLATYFSEYVARGDDKLYGLPLRPRYGEGGGCTAFAESFLEVGGLMTDEWASAWSRSLSVPEDLIGGESLGSLLFSRRARTWWRPAGAVRRDVFFWDPDRMFSWVRETWLTESRYPSGQYRLERAGLALGLRSNRVSAPVPSEPIWK